MDISSLRIVDWQISNKFKTLFALNAISCVGRNDASVSRYHKNSKECVILYGDLLYTFSAFTSLLISLACLIDEIITI